MPGYYIPFGDAHFDEWAQKFSTQLAAILTALGILPAVVDPDDISDAFDAWDTAYDAHQLAQATAQSAAEVKDEARVALQTLIRSVTQLLQKYPGMTNAQRDLLGITVPDLIRTPSSPDYVANLTPPLLKLETQRGQAIVHFGVNPGNEKLNAKPAGIAGAKIWYRSESGPWNFVADDTNSPYLHNPGNTEPVNLEYRAQWFDKKMRVGLFSESAKCSITP